jgi:hypothetical protein
MSIQFALPAALFIGALMPFVSAVPDVTPVRLNPGCYDFPLWQNVWGQDLTGGFKFMADQADDATINGFFASITTDTAADGTQTQTVMINNNDGAKPWWHCNKGIVSDLYTPSTIFFSGAPGDDQLTYLANGGAVETYAHEVDGVRQDGTFIGNGNATTWAFKYVPQGSAGDGDYYQMRLLLPDVADQLQDGEFAGFLQVVAA